MNLFDRIEEQQHLDYLRDRLKQQRNQLRRTQLEIDYYLEEINGAKRRAYVEGFELR